MYKYLILRRKVEIILFTFSLYSQAKSDVPGLKECFDYFIFIFLIRNKLYWQKLRGPNNWQKEVWMAIFANSLLTISEKVFFGKDILFFEAEKSLFFCDSWLKSWLPRDDIAIINFTGKMGTLKKMEIKQDKEDGQIRTRSF